jgi:hypothetical protein
MVHPDFSSVWKAGIAVVSAALDAKHSRARNPRQLAPGITRRASLQTFYTVKLLVDRDRVGDAYRAYAYFRWVDDRLDGGALTPAGRAAFVERQGKLVERAYRGDFSRAVCDEERMLIDLVRGDRTPDSGLQSYIRHMMAVMAFDAERRGRLISEIELANYTRWLAVAVTDALHYFIGHGCHAPRSTDRWHAAAGAHVTHMLRDTLDDIPAGYVNVPREVIEAGRFDPADVASAPYRDWVAGRVALARGYFRAGRAYLRRVENPRCRLAGYAYMARFEGVLDAIERDGYVLQADYADTKTLPAVLGRYGAVAREALAPCPCVMVHRRVSPVGG